MSIITSQSIACGNHEIHPVYSNHAIVKKKTVPKHSITIMHQTHHNPPMVLLQQRIEDVVIIWYRQVHQDMKYYSSHQQFNHNDNDDNECVKEKYIILEYCRKILYHILLVGHIQTINRPCPNVEYYTILCKQRFPSLQDLPCMVVTIQDWYFDLVLQQKQQQQQHDHHHRQNHSKMMLCLYQRFLSKEQQYYITVDKYINACENIVRKWIGLSHNETILITTTTTTTTTTPPTTTRTSIVPIQNQQQQHISIIMDNVHSNSSLECTRNQPVNYHRTSDSIINHPIDDKNIPCCVSSLYLLPTSLSSRSTPSLSDEYIEDGDKKPAAKPDLVEKKTIDCNNLPTAAVCCSTTITTSTTTTDGMNASSKNPNDRINRLRGMILMMYHAVKCPFHNPTSSNKLYHQKCPIYEGCDAIKKLQKHIAKTISFDPNHEMIKNGSNGMLHTCKCIYGVLCRDGKESIQHYINCQSMKCNICGPVLRHLPNMKQEIQNAILLLLQQQQQQQNDDDDLVNIVTEALISLSSFDKTPVITTTTTTKQHHNVVVPHNTTTTTMMNELATKNSNNNNNNNNNNTKTMKRTKITKRKLPISRMIPKENASTTTTTDKTINVNAMNSQVNDRNNNIKSIQKKKQKTCHHTITNNNNNSRNTSNNNNMNLINTNTLESFTTSPPPPLPTTTTTKTTTLSSSEWMVQQEQQQQIIILPPIILPPPNYISKSIK